MSTWQEYVKSASELGFTKVTIINRNNYQVLATTAEMDIPTAWNDGDKKVYIHSLHITTKKHNNIHQLEINNYITR